MASYKVLILSACLVSTAFGKATLGGLPGSALGGDGGVLGEFGDALSGIAGGTGAVGGGLLPGGPLGAFAGILKNLLGGFAGDAAGVASVIGDVLSLKPPAAVDDVLNIVGISAKAVSHIVSEVFPQFGQILDGVSQTIVSIARCVLGSQGISGAVLFDHRPGKLNPPQLQCDGHGSNSVDLSKFAGQLGLKKIIKDIEQFIASIQGGLEISQLPKSKVVVIQALKKLSKLLQKTNFGKSDISSYISIAITVVGSIANNVAPGTGNELVKHIVKILAPVLEKNGISSLSGELDQILKTLEGTSNDSGCWGSSGSGPSGSGIDQGSASYESSGDDSQSKQSDCSDEQNGSSLGYARKSGSVEKSGLKLKGQIKNSVGKTSDDDN